MRSAAATSPYLRAFGRLAAALVLALGLLSAAGAAHAMGGGFHGGGFHGGGFHGGGFHGGGFHGGFHGGFRGGFHDRFHGGFHHHRFHDGFFFGGFGGCCWGGYYPYYPYDYPSYYYPYDYPYYPNDYPSYYPPPAGVTQSQPNCQSGQWRQGDGSIISGTACLQPDGTWRMAY